MAKKIKKNKSKSRKIKSNQNKTILYAAVAVLLIIFISFGLKNNSTTSTKSTTKVAEQTVKENKVSDIKKTVEADKPLNIPKKEKAINQKKEFNAKEVEIKFASYDWDSNGKVSLEEFSYSFKNKDQAKKLFSRIDKNKDGSITLDEYIAFRKQGK